MSEPANEPGYLGRYIVLGEVGRGSMGRVVRAYDPMLGRTVAIKQVHAGPGSGSSPGKKMRRLLAEARALARIVHPNVVTLYDAHQLGPSAFALVMELVEGQTLEAWLRSCPRPRDRILALFVQAGRGILAAHDAGLLHRDFKPSNVLIGRGSKVKVLDFGLSRRALPASVPTLGDRESARNELTGAGHVVGTPRYMAPEQHRAQLLTQKIDQYAFCLSLWEALNDRPLFHDRCRAAAKLRGPGRWRARSTPRRIVRAIEKGLSPDPADRWPSMRELLAALDPPSARRRLSSKVGSLALAVTAGAAGHWVYSSSAAGSDAPALDVSFAEQGASEGRLP